MNNLPLDTQLEILKYYPKFRTLSSQYNKEIKLFYDMHCDDPISKKEYIDYVKSAKKFIIFIENQESYHCFVFKKEKNMYSVYSVYIEITNIDVDEYTISSNVNKYSLVDLDYIIHLIDSNGIFDLISMADILKSRSCEMIKPGYTKKYLKIKYKNYDLTSITGLYQQVRDLLYLIMNKNLIEGNNIVPNLPELLIYDSNDELINEDYLEEYEDIIKFFYDDAIIKIKKYINQL